MEKSKVMEFAKKKYEIKFLGGPTTPTYSLLKKLSILEYLQTVQKTILKNI